MIYSVKTRDKDGRRYGGICPMFRTWEDTWKYIKQEYHEINDEHFVFQVWLDSNSKFSSNMREIMYGDNADILAVDRFLNTVKGRDTTDINFSVSILDGTLIIEDWIADLTELFNSMVKYDFKSKDKSDIRVIIRYHDTGDILYECDYWEMMLIARYLYIVRADNEATYDRPYVNIL